MREERGLRAFQNWVLRKIFGPKMIAVTGSGGKRLHIEELNDLYCSPHITNIGDYKKN
jgi:hypothetical protein